MSRLRSALAAGRVPLVAAAASVVAVSMAPTPARAQGNTDVFLASLVLRPGAVQVTALRNVTAREGYDNQPAFSRDGRTLYFTSTREDAQADIYAYALADGTMSRVTRTAPESEYSATEVPDGGALSVIRVERDSTQRLWRVPLGTGTEAVILPSLKPVGYHAWADPFRLALFVLGAPPVLVLADVRTGRADTLMVNIGRSLHRIPGGSHVSVVSKAYEENWYIMDLDVDTRAMRPVAKLPKGTEDYAWLPDGRLIAGSGSKLFVADPSRAAEWVEVADLGSGGVTGITRLAVSPAGDRVAIVAIPATR
ncbi:MAG: PD40 domain-containing protein [Gemmatimonadaceae bacterium]|jgi:dipeptidyl aminopeptidase/acylaminoacyl peptidase|nr:PD40 domain-containing protein [Gemmatimonadota bacterium]MCC7322742.1 PD40 domain-containing protein [Gemmatimonadaceae bacterium]HNV75049.1 hypothetical protein [Gemmatimonadaceae bacterium]